MLLQQLLSAHLQIRGVRGLDQLLSADENYRNYLLACKSEGKAGGTLNAYARALSELGIFLKQYRGEISAPSTVTPTDLRLWFVALKEIPGKHGTLSDFTLHQYYRSIKTFFLWLIREGIIEKSPLQNIKPPITPKKIIRPFSEQDINKLLALTAGGKFLERRNRAMILLFMDAGLRLKEMTDLVMSSIDLDHNTLRVFGKGRKERIVPLGKNVQSALIQYFVLRTDTLPSFWVSEERRPMTRDGIETTIKRLCYRAEVTTKKGPHTFRHTAAHHCRKNGMTIEEIQYLLGHTSPETTRKYLGTFDATEQMITAHRRASPVDTYLRNKKA
jgi:site-specific recombinase XerD